MADDSRESNHSGGLAPRRDEQGLYNSSGGAGHVFRKSLLQTLTVLVIVVLALLVQQTIYILLLVFAGVLLAVLLDFFGRQIMRVPRMPHWLAVTIALMILAAFMMLVVVLVVPVAVEESQELATQIEQSLEQLMHWLEQTVGGQFLVERFPDVDQPIADAGGLWSGVAGIFVTTMGAITGLTIIVVVGIFIAYSPGMYREGFLHLIPVSHRQRAAEIMAAVGLTLRWWLLGQLISMATLALSTWIMLALMGVRQALILALITGLMTFVPYLGPLIALIPIILVAFLESPTLALYVFILYMAIQNVEANLIMPVIFSRTAHIPPALGVISQILFGNLLGVLGFILAIPLMAVILQFIKMIYVEDILGDTTIESD